LYKYEAKILNAVCHIHHNWSFVVMSRPFDSSANHHREARHLAADWTL